VHAKEMLATMSDSQWDSIGQPWIEVLCHCQKEIRNLRIPRLRCKVMQSCSDSSVVSLDQGLLRESGVSVFFLYAVMCSRP
jgi:hypothetical protein